jgi:hypothetical protein
LFPSVFSSLFPCGLIEGFSRFRFSFSSCFSQS